MVVEKDEKLVRKIKKLLALAGNNAEEKEAEQAMLKAQRLMAEYHIEMSDVDGADTSPKEPIGIGYTDETIASHYKYRLAHVIADNFKVLVFMTKVGKGQARRISFYGYQSDVEMAISLFKFVINVMEYNWWHVYYGKVFGNKKDYSMGFVNGLSSKFAAQVAQNGWGLVVQVPHEVEEACDKNYKSVDIVSVARTTRSDAYLHGMKDGYKFDQNKKSLME